MSGHFLCGKCGYYRMVDDAAVGRTARCPSCRSIGRIHPGRQPPYSTVPTGQAEDRSHKPSQAEPHAFKEAAPPGLSEEIIDATLARSKVSSPHQWAQWASGRIDHVTSSLRIAHPAIYVGVGSSAAVAVAVGVVLLLVKGASWLPKSYATDSNDTLDVVDSVLDGEEALKPVRLVVGRESIFMQTFDAGIRAVVWRKVSNHRVTEPRVRLSCGVWLVEGKSALRELTNISWIEREFEQLDEDGVERLIKLIEAMDRARFADPGDLNYRDIEASFGDFQFRKQPEQGLQMMIPLEDRVLWEQVNTEELLKFLTDVRNQMRQLRDHPTTIRWK